MINPECEVKNQDCAMQHIIVFQKQSLKHKEADFSEPCQTCKHANECTFDDWFQKISSALPNTTIQIKLAH